VAAAALTAAPLLATDASGREMGEMGMRLIVWCAMAALAHSWAQSIRSERVRRTSAEAQAQRLALAGPLTGLPNRRAFDRDIQAGIAAARAAGGPLSVLVADLDDFKDINDTFGHLEGDSCLRAVAVAQQQVMRDGDLVYRWGGDEFAVLLPGQDRDAATRVGRRLAQVVAASCRRPDGAPVHISGCAGLGAHQDARALIAAADADLLERKRAGGDAGPRLAAAS